MSYATNSGSPLLSILGGLAKGYQERQQADDADQQAADAKTEQNKAAIMQDAMRDPDAFLKNQDLYTTWANGQDKATQDYLATTVNQLKTRNAGTRQGGAFGSGGSGGGFGQAPPETATPALSSPADAGSQEQCPNRVNLQSHTGNSYSANIMCP